MSATLPTIAIIRETTMITDAQVRALVPALQTQVSRDFAPHWGLDATIRFCAAGEPVPQGAWRIVLLDNSDQAGDLGYHLVEGGLPLANVYIQDCFDNGVNWSVTVSHEMLEMLADPDIQKVATVVKDGNTFEIAFEVADAPEDDQFAYAIDGHYVSDFVLPSWFRTDGTAPFTFRDNPHVLQPLQLAPGGYVGWRQVAPYAGQWEQVFADGPPGPRTDKGPQSRTKRRFNRA